MPDKVSKAVVSGKTTPMWLFSCSFFFFLYSISNAECRFIHLLSMLYVIFGYVSSGDKLEPLAEFLCHIMASFFPSAELWHAAVSFYWGLTAHQWRQSHSRPRLSLGFPPLLFIIDGASDIGAGNWKYLAADESGDCYFCGLLRHLADVDGFYYCSCSPMGNAGGLSHRVFL